MIRSATGSCVAVALPSTLSSLQCKRIEEWKPSVRAKRIDREGERERGENQAFVHFCYTLLWIWHLFGLKIYFFTEHTHNVAHKCVQTVHSTYSCKPTTCEIFMTVFRSHHMNEAGVCVCECVERARVSITKILNPLKLPSLLPTIRPLYALYEHILFIYIEYKLFSNLGICARVLDSVPSAEMYWRS